MAKYQETPEVQQARMIHSSLASRRKKEPDFNSPSADKILPPDLSGKGQKIFTANREDDAYCCLTCRKTIFRLELNSLGDKGGQIIRPLPDCGCNAKRRDAEIKRSERQKRNSEIQRLFMSSIISPRIEKASFDNWDTRPGTESAYRKAVEYANNFDEDTDMGIFFTGQVGNGKSHLARSIQRRIHNSGYVTLFLEWLRFAEIARSTFNGGRGNVADMVRAACGADFLVLDELGAGPLTDWEYKSLMLPIINGRDGKGTAITTNLSLSELEHWLAYDGDGKPLDEKGRVYDRIVGGFDFVKNNGTSNRRERASEKRKGG